MTIVGIYWDKVVILDLFKYDLSMTNGVNLHSLVCRQPGEFLLSL